ELCNVLSREPLFANVLLIHQRCIERYNLVFVCSSVYLVQQGHLVGVSDTQDEIILPMKDVINGAAQHASSSKKQDSLHSRALNLFRLSARIHFPNALTPPIVRESKIVLG